MNLKIFKSYKENDFDKFVNEINELIKKKDKNNKEEKLVIISKEHLKEFI